MYNGPEEEEKEDTRHTQFLQFFFSLNQNAARKRMKCQIWEYGTGGGGGFHDNSTCNRFLAAKCPPPPLSFFWFTFLTTLTTSSYVQIDTPICPKSKKRNISSVSTWKGKIIRFLLLLLTCEWFRRRQWFYHAEAFIPFLLNKKKKMERVFFFLTSTKWNQIERTFAHLSYSRLCFLPFFPTLSI
jgi:hypothetical protein